MVSRNGRSFDREAVSTPFGFKGGLLRLDPLVLENMLVLHLHIA